MTHNMEHLKRVFFSFENPQRPKILEKNKTVGNTRPPGPYQTTTGNTDPQSESGPIVGPAQLSELQHNPPQCPLESGRVHFQIPATLLHSATSDLHLFPSISVVHVDRPWP